MRIQGLNAVFNVIRLIRHWGFISRKANGEDTFWEPCKNTENLLNRDKRYEVRWRLKLILDMKNPIFSSEVL